MVSSYPAEVGSNLELLIFDVNDICNNKLLDETYSFRENRKRLR